MTEAPEAERPRQHVTVPMEKSAQSPQVLKSKSQGFAAERHDCRQEAETAAGGRANLTHLGAPEVVEHSMTHRSPAAGDKTGERGGVSPPVFA